MNRIGLTRKKIFFITLFLTIFIVGTVLILIIPIGVKSTYGQTVQTTDGITISFNVFEPRRPGTNKKAVILGHGIMSNKEMLKGYAIELAAAGFVAVPFDFRGHGQSTGEFDRGSLTTDIDAIISYLNSRSDINTSSLGYFGFSMGGFPGIQIVNSSTAFKCFIGAATWLPEEVRKGNSTDHLNILMILGRYDELITPEDLKLGLSNYTGLPISDLDVNKLYGSFQDGNASMIYLDDTSNHVLGDWDPDFIRETRNFVMNTFPDVKPVDENFYANIRLLILFLQLFGGFGFFLLIVDPLSKLLLKPKENKAFKIQLEGDSIRSLSIKTILYSLLLGLPGIVMFVPIILLLYVPIAGFVLALLFGQAFGFLILLWRLVRKIDIPLGTILKKPFQGSKNNVIRQFLLGIILAIIFIVIIYLSIGLNYMGIIPSLVKIPWLFLIFPISFTIFMVFSIFVQGILQNKFHRGIKDLMKISLLQFGFLFLYMSTYLLIIALVMNNFFYFGSFLPIAFPVFLLISVFSTFIYQKSGNIISGLIVITLFFTLLVCAMSSYESGINFIMGFFR
jgi:dienelactone hydrolase